MASKLSQIELVTRSFRRRVLAREALAAKEMAVAYRDIRKGLYQAIAEVEAFIASQAEKGVPIRVGALFREQRLRNLLRQVQNEITTFTEKGELISSEAQRDAIRLALSGAESVGQIITPQGMTWHSISQSAITALEGALQPKSPLAMLFAKLGEEQGIAAASSLRKSLAIGRNPKQAARYMRRVVDMTFKRALLISRTEMLRAYREATRETYRENEHLVSGYQWVATLSPRTCAACLAMHGTYHKVSETFGTHPRCRCTMIPVLRSGVGEERQQKQKFLGEMWLRQQPRTHREAVLGREGARLFDAGRLELTDFVKETRSREWGLTRTTGSVVDAEQKRAERLKKESQS